MVEISLDLILSYNCFDGLKSGFFLSFEIFFKYFYYKYLLKI